MTKPSENAIRQRRYRARLAADPYRWKLHLERRRNQVRTASYRIKSTARVRRWRQKQKDNPKWLRKRRKHYELTNAIRRYKYQSDLKYRKAHDRYCRKRDWIIRRLVLMAKDDGTWKLLKQEYDNGQRSL